MAYQPLRYWGGDTATQRIYDRINAQNMEEMRRQRDEESLAKWGFTPDMGPSVRAAQDAAEAEWQQVVKEMEGRLGELRDDPTAQRLRSYYEGVLGGTDLPFGAGEVASITSATTAPLMEGARSEISRLRDQAAARGLGRSSGLGSAESRYRTEAITGAARAAGDIRTNAALQNYQAREGAAGGLQSFYGSQQGMINSIQSELARLRAARQYDPSQFLDSARTGQSGRTTPTSGGYSTPPPQANRSRGRSTPSYQGPNAWAVTARAL